VSCHYEFPPSDFFKEVDIEAPILGSKSADPSEFAGLYRAAGKLADEGSATSRVYGFLAELCDFHFRPTEKVEPFSNRIGWGNGSRTLIGSDLDGEIIETLDALTATISNAALKTRIADLVWSRDKRRHVLARTAVDGYVSLLRGLIDGQTVESFGGGGATGILSQQYLERATTIARSIGWLKGGNEPLRGIYSEVLRIARAEGGVTLARFGSLATDIRLPAAEILLADLATLAKKAAEKQNFYDAEALQRLAIRRARLRRDAAAEPQHVLQLVEILELKAQKAPESAMLTAHALQEAYDALHGQQNVREVRQRLHDKLREAQLHMFEEFSTSEHSLDLTDATAQILAGFEGLDLLDSLRRFALAELPQSRSDLETAAKEQMQAHLLSSIFSTAIVDSKGRTTARVGGGLESEESLRYKVLQNLNIRMGVAVAGAINPIRSWITERFTVDEHVVFELCRLSPFVPSGSEHTFARGLQAFLYGDDQVATPLLVPYVEAGIRAMVGGVGLSDTKLLGRGIEETLGLSALIENHREVLEQVFGEGLIYAIENLFIHDLGPKVRHNFCHGLSMDGSFYSDEYVSASKLIFTMVMFPLLSDKEWPRIKQHVLSKVNSPSLQ
jgi:hypothetical protein